jgi:hypothetical protein
MKKFLFSLILLFPISLILVSPVFAHCGETGAQCSDAIITEKLKDGSYVVHQDDVKVFSKLPLRFDTIRKSFFVQVAGGKEFEVKADPQKAKGMAYSTGMLTDFAYDGEDKIINLTERDGKIFYEVKGWKKGKILGLFPVSFDVMAEIDAEGKLSNFEKPWVLKILKYFLK